MSTSLPVPAGAGHFDPVDAIFERHGIRGAWSPLRATGVASRVYATADVVLKVATDHRDGVVDAKTESVAAPAAWRAGILTPALIAFDESGELTSRPYTIWERVHAETVGLAGLGAAEAERLWHETGRELGRLHTLVVSCPDPKGYLDDTERGADMEDSIRALVASGNASGAEIAAIGELARELAPWLGGVGPACFVHNDMHEMNLLCTAGGELRALIDWGDAGWGDAALDFASVPLAWISAALDGYGRDNRPRLGERPEARFIWDRLLNAVDDRVEDAEMPIPLREYRRFLEKP